jgi:hypothetical protein
MTLVTLDPTGVQPVETHAIAPRISGLQGKRVGLLNNVKTNSKELILELGALLQERYGVTLVGPVLTQGQSGMLAAPGQLENLAEQSDLVIHAIGD